MGEPPNNIISGGYFSFLPKEVIAIILFKLNFHNIKKCYLTDRVFHCFKGKQLKLIKNISKGSSYNIKKGNMDVCEWIYDRKKTSKQQKFIKFGFSVACEYGQLDICKWLYDLSIIHDVKLQLDNTLIEESIEHINVETINWLYELIIGLGRPVDIINDIFIPSQQKGNLPVCQWVYKLIVKKKINIINCIHCSIENGHYNVMKWIYDEIYPTYNILIINRRLSLDNSGTLQKVFNNACTNGHYDMACWLYYRSIEMERPVDINNNDYFNYSKKLFTICIDKNHLDVAKWICSLYEFDMMIMENTYLNYCKTNDHEKAKIVENIGFEVGKPVNPHFYKCKNKNLELCKNAYDIVSTNILVNKYNYFKSRFIVACEIGYLELVQWLYDCSVKQGYPIMNCDITLGFLESCINGHFKIVLWLYELSIELETPIIMDHIYKPLIVICYCKEYLDIAKWLYNLNKEIEKPINLNNSSFTQFDLKSNDVIIYNGSIPKVTKWLYMLDNVKEIEKIEN